MLQQVLSQNEMLDFVALHASARSITIHEVLVQAWQSQSRQQLQCEHYLPDGTGVTGSVSSAQLQGNQTGYMRPC